MTLHDKHLRTNKTIILQNISKERREYIQDILDDSNLTWTSLITWGAAFLTSLRININNSIFCDSYVHCYETHSRKIFTSKIFNSGKYRDVYIYWVLMGARGMVHLYVSYDEPLTPENRHLIQHIRKNKRHIRQPILEQLVFGDETLVPE